MIIGIDPGPTTCGIVILDGTRVTLAHKAATVPECLHILRGTSVLEGYSNATVAIERVQSYGIAGASLLQTAEVCGRLQQCAEDSGHMTLLFYRREVLRALDVTGKGSRDAVVRQRLLEIWGGDPKALKGTKRDPGPLYGVAGHAWQALAVAVVAREIG